ncbi:hypothetical protein [Faecalibaculum rodentium]|uniref:hypothetical protein n=1 Tax=Faecalibaculum rodentium TaxID=1702221 RepID=UPI00119DF341|nr:hypothetical protein [Faecalibaculum rodentium]
MIIKVIPFMSEYFLSQGTEYHTISHNDVSSAIFSEKYSIFSVAYTRISDIFKINMTPRGSVMAAGRDPVRLLRNIRSGIYCVNWFATTMKMEELPEILEQYQVPVTADVEEEVLTMCNLGESVYEKGMKAGRLRAREIPLTGPADS